MKHLRHSGIIAVLLAFALLAAGCGSSGKPSSPSAGNTAGPQTDQEDPSTVRLQSFSAETFTGGTFTQQDLEGKDATIINFWSISCGYCVQEMPEIAAFQQALPDNVQLLTFCLDDDSDRQAAQKVLDDAGWQGTALINGSGDLEAVVQSVMYLPTTVFIGSDGTLWDQAVIGAPEDLAATYQDAVNTFLRENGIPEITLHEN